MHNVPVRSSWCAGLIGLTALLWPLSSVAAPCPALPPKPEDCRKESDPGQRLDCYDHAVDGTPWDKTSKQAVCQIPEAKVPDNDDTSALHKDWNLTGSHEYYHPAIQAYRENYLLLANWSDSPNRMPFSPAHLPSPASGSDPTEVKFQFSLKSELTGGDAGQILKAAGFDKYAIWFAYTQQSYWQFYDTKDSRPFRDNNYQPEIILTLGRPDHASFLAPLKLINIGLVHQSNGDSDPLSRSWNRVYGQADFEFGKFTVYARAWWRIPEPRASDDNPNILEYVGRGEITGRWANNGTSVALMLRDNLSLNPNRGFAQLDVNLPFFCTCLRRDGLTMHFQATTGYGDTLLDYNHRQTTVGFGMAFGGGGE